MLSLLEIAARSQSGPKQPENEWDMGLFFKLTELAKRHDIAVPETVDWFNMDDDLAERALLAGVDFLCESGVYCVSTGRIVQFTRDDVLQAIEQAPSCVAMGAGGERATLTQKRVEGDQPLDVCPGLHAPYSSDLGALALERFASVPRAAFLEGFNFRAVDGHEIFGLPMEAHATRRQAAMLRQSAARADKPGMALVLYPISTRAGALMAAMDDERGLRPTDGMLLSVLPDVKMEHDMLSTAMIAHDRGMFTLGNSYSLVGGFCGGIEGAIIEAVAKPLAALLVYGDAISSVGVADSRGVAQRSASFQPTSWASSVVFQALNKHTHTICMAWISSVNGPGSEGMLTEVAIRAIMAQVNGGNLYAVRHSRAETDAAQTPLEAHWMVEVADATLRAGLDRTAAGRVCRALSERLAHQEPEPGRPISACYDLERGQPLPDYAAKLRRLKDDLADMGLSFA